MRSLPIECTQECRQHLTKPSSSGGKVASNGDPSPNNGIERRVPPPEHCFDAMPSPLASTHRGSSINCQRSGSMKNETVHYYYFDPRLNACYPFIDCDSTNDLSSSLQRQQLVVVASSKGDESVTTLVKNHRVASSSRNKFSSMDECVSTCRLGGQQRLQLIPISSTENATPAEDVTATNGNSNKWSRKIKIHTQSLNNFIVTPGYSQSMIEPNVIATQLWQKQQRQSLVATNVVDKNQSKCISILIINSTLLQLYHVDFLRLD